MIVCNFNIRPNQNSLLLSKFLLNNCQNTSFYDYVKSTTFICTFPHGNNPTKFITFLLFLCDIVSSGCMNFLILTNFAVAYFTFLNAHLKNGTYYGNTCRGRASGEYVGGHNISTKFYNQLNSPKALLNYSP